MPEQFFNIPNNIVRRGGSVGGGGNSVSAELILVDLGATGFVLQLGSVMVIEDAPQENVIVSMIIQGPNPNNPPIPPIVEDRVHVPLVQSGPLNADRLGRYVGIVNGPVPVRPGEKLLFRLERKARVGTFTFHAHVWGFAL